MNDEWTEPDLRPKPTSITLDIAEDLDSIRLWWIWSDLSQETRKKLADLAEEEASRSLPEAMMNA